MEFPVNPFSRRLGRSGLALVLLAGFSAVGCSASTGEDTQSSDSALSLAPILKPGPVTPITPPISPIKPFPIYLGPTGCNAPSPITDWGYANFRAYGDANGDGVQDYCRFVGDAPNVFLSCQLGCEAGNYGVSTGFSSVQGIDQGYGGTGQMVDVNGDKRADFCRTVGNAPNTFSACDLAGTSGFGADTFEISYPVGFTPSAPIAVVNGSDGTPIDVYRGPNALWFHGKDAAGVKRELTLGTSGNYTTMSIVENGASIVALSLTADAAGYVTIYGKTPTLNRSYRFYSSAQNWTSSGFLTDFAPALQHFGYFQSVGTNVQSNLTKAMAALGITNATPANVTVQRASNAGFWAAVAFIAITAVAGVSTGGTSLIIQTAIVLLAGAGGALGDAAITEGTEANPSINSSTPIPPAGTTSTPPSTTCDSTVASCASPDPTGTGPSDGSGDGTGDGSGDGTGGTSSGGGSTGGGGACEPDGPDFAVRHANWTKVHPAEICDDCCGD
jgi:uncharacterized membrane protein YgcG